MTPGRCRKVYASPSRQCPVPAEWTVLSDQSVPLDTCGRHLGDVIGLALERIRVPGKVRKVEVIRAGTVAGPAAPPPRMGTLIPPNPHGIIDPAGRI
jgi:hypothetical protein